MQSDIFFAQADFLAFIQACIHIFVHQARDVLRYVLKLITHILWSTKWSGELSGACMLFPGKITKYCEPLVSVCCYVVKASNGYLVV